MWVLYKKEISSFFSSVMGYIAISVFLVFLGLMNWVFPDFSMLEFEFATLDPMFQIMPIVFLFLIPAITMSSFAEEVQTGTIETLMTKPLSLTQIIWAKFAAAWTIVCIAIIPTLLYVYSIYQLGSPIGNIDLGAVAGGYIGLLFLAAAFCSIGIFGSSLSSNQIVGFIVAFFLCFFMYLGFEFSSRFPSFIGNLDDVIDRMGISYHYEAMNRGLIDMLDVMYFICVISVFLIFCYAINLKKR